MTKSSNTDDSAHQLWNFFASVKLSVVILLSLAMTSIIGTIIPQNESPMLYHQKFSEGLFKLFNTLDIFDMYHSWWFRFLLCMLTVNIIVCSINRLSSTWKIIFPKKPSFNINRFRKAKNRQQWSAAGSVEQVKDVTSPWLSKRFNRFTVESSENGYLLFGEKNRWTRLGIYAVHLSIILMIAGGMVGSLFGFDGFVNIPEGESVDSILRRNNQPEVKLNFKIKCDDFDLTLYESGLPKEYRSSLSLIRNDQIIIQKNIIVNDPLRFEGINIFQSSYGKIPSTETIPVNKFTVTITEKASGLIYNKKAAIETPIEMPGNSGTLVVVDFRRSIPYHGIDMPNAFLCRMDNRNGEPEHFIIPADSPRFDVMRKGDFIISINNVEFKDVVPEIQYYTGLQVTKDPGVPIVYVGFLFMIIGCYVTFFMFHQKLCIEISTDRGKTAVTVSGISEKNKPGMNAIIRRLSKQLQKLT
ncbi:MAG: cytochrome c biogenesis protein ResB [Desulfobacteraceae bacterium]|nr:cytochrome c biogenesis protein ResB [Desulfobacteraceae bacterium]